MKKFFGYVLRLFVFAIIIYAVSEFINRDSAPSAGAGSRNPVQPVDVHLTDILDPADRYKNSLCGVSLLNAAEKHVYCILRDGFAQVAGGDRFDTEFEMNTDGLGISYLFGTLTGLDISKVQTALWMDCPYEMYWNYRSKGWEYECVYEKESANINSGDVTSLTVRCEVLPEYAPGGADGGYATDPDKIQTARLALQNAQGLVNQCSGLSDYDKLVAYRDYICDQVEYDHVAAALPDEDKGKGPWQIVHVFDQNPLTNVVCEGYAKAFKYLCDLSDFSGDVNCYLVDGVTTGPHAWNLVEINGLYYMADITGCDSEWGRLGGLFLAGAADATWEGFTVECPQYDMEDGSYFPATSRHYIYSEETKRLYLHMYLTLAPTNYNPELNV